jgi:hypothetical protein
MTATPTPPERIHWTDPDPERFVSRRRGHKNPPLPPPDWKKVQAVGKSGAFDRSRDALAGPAGGPLHDRVHQAFEGLRRPLAPQLDPSFAAIQAVALRQLNGPVPELVRQWLHSGGGFAMRAALEVHRLRRGQPGYHLGQTPGFEEASLLDPDDLWEPLREGLAHAKGRDHDAALAVAREAVPRLPPGLRAFVAYALPDEGFEVGLLAPALAAIKAEPSDPPDWVAYLLSALTDPAEALALLQAGPSRWDWFQVVSAAAVGLVDRFGLAAVPLLRDLMRYPWWSQGAIDALLRIESLEAVKLASDRLGQLPPDAQRDVRLAALRRPDLAVAALASHLEDGAPWGGPVELLLRELLLKSPALPAPAGLSAVARGRLESLRPAAGDAPAEGLPTVLGQPPWPVIRAGEHWNPARNALTRDQPLLWQTPPRPPFLLLSALRRPLTAAGLPLSYEAAESLRVLLQATDWGAPPASVAEVEAALTPASRAAFAADLLRAWNAQSQPGQHDWVLQVALRWGALEARSLLVAHLAAPRNHQRPAQRWLGAIAAELASRPPEAAEASGALALLLRVLWQGQSPHQQRAALDGLFRVGSAWGRSGLELALAAPPVSALISAGREAVAHPVVERLELTASGSLQGVGKDGAVVARPDAALGPRWGQAQLELQAAGRALQHLLGQGLARRARLPWATLSAATARLGLRERLQSMPWGAYRGGALEFGFVLGPDGEPEDAHHKPVALTGQVVGLLHPAEVDEATWSALHHALYAYKRLPAVSPTPQPLAKLGAVGGGALLEVERSTGNEPVFARLRDAGWRRVLASGERWARDLSVGPALLLERRVLGEGEAKTIQWALRLPDGLRWDGLPPGDRVEVWKDLHLAWPTLTLKLVPVV